MNINEVTAEQQKHLVIRKEKGDYIIELPWDKTTERTVQAWGYFDSREAAQEWLSERHINLASCR